MNNRISEGTESAARLLRLPVVNTMTDDRFNLHRVSHISQQAREDSEQMEALRQWRESQQAIEYAGDEPSGIDWIAIAAVCIVLAAILVASFSAEIAESLYAFTK